MTDNDARIAENIKQRLIEYKFKFPNSLFVVAGEYNKCLCFIETIINRNAN